VIETIRQGLKEDGFDVSISKLCKWFEVPRRTVYYRPTKAEPKVQDRLLTPIKAMIEENPSFGYRTVAHLLEFNKNCAGPDFPGHGFGVKSCLEDGVGNVEREGCKCGCAGLAGGSA